MIRPGKAGMTETVVVGGSEGILMSSFAIRMVAAMETVTVAGSDSPNAPVTR